MAASVDDKHNMAEPEDTEDDGKLVDLVSQEGDNFQVEKKL